ncbi:MAG: hypothetical protein ACOX23_01635 [Peptococcia bacterium]|jgi:hypothetical protein
MSQKLWRIFTIIVISVTTLSLFVGGTYFFERFIYTNPLEKTVAQLDGVEQFTVQQNKEQLLIEVQFKQEGKLRPSFYQLLEEVERQNKLANTDLIIKIANSPDQDLGTFLQSGKLPIYEAISTGEFTRLPEKLTALSRQKGISYELDLDEQYVFLTAQKDGKTGYQVIKRAEKASDTETPISVFTIMGEEYL